MVEIESLPDDNEETKKQAAAASTEEESSSPVESASESRILDAEEIERVAATLTRPTARAQLEALAKKLKREGLALRRVAESHASKQSSENVTDDDEEDVVKVEEVTPSEKAVATKLPAAPAQALPKPVPVAVGATATTTPPAHYNTIDRFSFDAGKYDSPFVTLYVPLPSVGSHDKDKITCDFTSTQFDLIVRDLSGKSYRLFKDNLDNEIDPSKSKYIVKADKILVKLGKKKGEYGSYDHWSDLTAKKAKKKKGASKEDPAAGIMDLMKDMYESGDDKMKKMIGETMMKQRRGELNGPGDMGMGDMGMGGMGGMGGF
mmetsp:Transcript_19074/g.25178  ORF Transcript_19074/g.25178 Transcript_19074/m.25178 type:complete len:319 (+) Transcript_19074:94-1050(+)